VHGLELENCHGNEMSGHAFVSGSLFAVPGYSGDAASTNKLIDVRHVPIA